MIEVEGKKYKCVETLGYQQAGMLAKVLLTPDGEKIAVKRGGKWTWWDVLDRLGQCEMTRDRVDGIL